MLIEQVNLVVNGETSPEMAKRISSTSTKTSNLKPTFVEEATEILEEP